MQVAGVAHLVERHLAKVEVGYEIGSAFLSHKMSWVVAIQSTGAPVSLGVLEN